MLGLVNRGFTMPDMSKHLVNTLKSYGYTTALSGVQHVAHDGTAAIGYDEHLAEPDNAHTAAVDYLKHPPEQPFFLSVGFFETHREFPEEVAYDPNYCRPPAPLPDTFETRLDMARYKTSARILDTKIGQVLDALEASGYANETLVICTTDHGIPFPGMKCTLTDHGIGVMLIIRGPGGFTGGRVVDALVSHIDIFPTICDLVGIQHPDWLQGKSLLPLIHGEVDQINDEIFAQVDFHAAYEPQRCVRTERFKYIRRYDGREKPVLPNCNDGLSKDLLLQHGWRDHKIASEQLYDLIFDPDETRNLVDEPTAESVLRDMQERLDSWMKATDDPLLKGRGEIQPPPGSELNDPDDLSPDDPTTVYE